MDQSPTIDVKNYLPEIHQKYLAYKKENPNNNENKNRFKKEFEDMAKDYNQFFDQNINGYSLFEYFIIYEDIEAISATLTKIKQLSLPQDIELQILELSVASNNKNLLQLLVRHGLNIDLPDESRSTQLALAAGRCDMELCGLLLSCGANIRFVNTISKKSILALACECTEEIELSEKSDCINLLSVWYLSQKLEPLLSNVNISDEIAKNIFLFGASNFGEALTFETSPRFKYAYKNIDHFFREIDKIFLDKNNDPKNQINLESLKKAVDKCLLIAQDNSTLISFRQKLGKYVNSPNSLQDTDTFSAPLSSPHRP